MAPSAVMETALSVLSVGYFHPLSVSNLGVLQTNPNLQPVLAAGTESSPFSSWALRRGSSLGSSGQLEGAVRVFSLEFSSPAEHPFRASPLGRAELRVTTVPLGQHLLQSFG